VEACEHEEIRQISTITAETIWMRSETGTYMPDEEINKVLGEDTELWECVSCGEEVEPPASS
jgi:hypothetical protein